LGLAHTQAKISFKPKPKAQPVAFVRPKEELKMVLCVNEALKMGKGKIGEADSQDTG
jgi:hypothetical protein